MEHHIKMKLTITELKQIIREEILNEGEGAIIDQIDKEAAISWMKDLLSTDPDDREADLDDLPNIVQYALDDRKDALEGHSPEDIEATLTQVEQELNKVTREDLEESKQQTKEEFIAERLQKLAGLMKG
jgi:hypothetical protein